MMDNATKYDIDSAVTAQRKLQKDRNYPSFAPATGRCYRCKNNIYKPRSQERNGVEYTTGISVEEAATELITGCPHCNYSFCS